MPKSKPKVDLKAKGDVNVNGDIIGHDQNINNFNISLAPDSTTYATRAEYLAQLIDRHQDLEFVGIPELKDRHALRIEEVFIHLQAETEQEERELRELRELKELSREQQHAEDSEFLQFPSKFPQFQKLKRRLSANEALRENKLLVILGDPGAGKTTLLKYITLAFAQSQSDKLGLSEERLPIFVRLYDYVAKRPERSDKGFSLVDYLYVHARENLHLALEPNFFESELERGNCCVCLDGLDELGGAGLRREVTAAVAALVNRYRGNRFVITSRSVGYAEAPLDRREFIHHTVLPLSDDDIREFVQKWYAAREKDPTAQRERAEHLTKTIMAEPRIKSLAANPLMLTIIALVHRIEAELPHERVKLYDKCVTALVETWEQVKELKVEDRQRPYYKYRRRLLEQLAYWMHTQSTRAELVEARRPSTSSAHEKSSGRAPREIKEGDLELQLTRFLLDNPKLQLDDEAARQEACEFIALAKARTGLLIERGEGVYVFVHLTFQEYLAACDIERRCDTADKIWQAIQPRLHDPHWREVILLLLGIQNRYDNRPTELVRRIYESSDEYEDILHRHLFLAARVLADRAEVEAALQNAIVKRLLEIARSEGLAWRDACEALGWLGGDRRAGEGLLTLARDEKVDADVRRNAAHALGQLSRADDAIPILLALARDKKVDMWVQSDVALALGELGRTDEAVLSSLLTLTRDENVDAWVRSVGAFALGRLGCTDAAAPILLALARDENLARWVQCAAAESLGQLGRADDAIPILLTLARDKKVDVWVRDAAAEALGQLGHADDAVLSSLLALARDENIHARVRSAAAESLGQLGHADAAIPILLTLARDENVHALVRSAAARALGQLGLADAATPILLALARDENVHSGVRSDAARALGQLGSADAAIPILLTLARDKKVDAWGRRTAARALGQLGRADAAIPTLLTLARDEKVKADVRRDAYKSLKALMGGEAE